MPKVKTKAKEKETKTIFGEDKLEMVVDVIMRNAETSHKLEWDEKGNEATITLKTGGIIKAIFPNNTAGKKEFVFLTDKEGTTYLNQIMKRASVILTDVALKQTIFGEVSLENIKTGYMRVGTNLLLLKELENEFKSVGIESVGFSQSPIERIDDNATDKVTLVFNPHIPDGRNALPSSFFDKYRRANGFMDPQVGGAKLTPTKDEKVIELKREDLIFGEYYQDRNLVLIWFNPFKRINLESLNSFKENEYLEMIMIDIISTLRIAKITRKNVTNFKVKLLVHSFNRESRNNLGKLKRTHAETLSGIQSLEQDLTNRYGKAKDIQEQLDALLNINGDAIELFIKEIEIAKQMKLVENIELKSGAVHITYKPATIKIPFSRNMEEKGEFGIREIYVGRLTVSVTGDGSISVKNDAPTIGIGGEHGHDHPHASGGRPCLGEGSGPRNMKKLIGERKFSDFVLCFWMWIKRYRAEDCYVKPWLYYDDRLKQGYPIFDQTGTRIVINDKERLNTKEQHKLTPTADYDKNMALFKKFKPQA